MLTEHQADPHLALIRSVGRTLRVADRAAGEDVERARSFLWSALADGDKRVEDAGDEHADGDDDGLDPFEGDVLAGPEGERRENERDEENGECGGFEARGRRMLGIHRSHYIRAVGIRKHPVFSQGVSMSQHRKPNSV